MKQEIVKYQKPEIIFPHCEIKKTGLVFSAKVSFDEWSMIGESLQQVEGSVLWWLGDWMNYGESKYGEKYSQALEASDYAYQTLRDASWVTSRVEMSRRRDNLTFAHHREVAPLEPDEQDKWLDHAEAKDLTHKELRCLIRESKVEAPAEGVAGAVIKKQDALDFLSSLENKSADLLLTDPPYMTDVADIAAFAAKWVPIALAKVKDTGRAYIFTGAYPVEVQAYLAPLLKESRMKLENILVWAYRNTLGPAPKMGYKLNWQACFYLYGPAAPPLDCPVMVEQFTVQDINAPDGRLGDRYHAWQKPDKIAERFIRHSSKPGDTVIDPFAGTGTFLLAAVKFGRIAIGSEINNEILDIAKARGIKVKNV